MASTFVSAMENDGDQNSKKVEKIFLRNANETQKQNKIKSRRHEVKYFGKLIRGKKRKMMNLQIFTIIIVRQKPYITNQNDIPKELSKNLATFAAIGLTLQPAELEKDFVILT